MSVADAVHLAERLERHLRREAEAFLFVETGMHAGPVSTEAHGTRRSTDLALPRPAPANLVRVTVEVVQ